MADKPASERTEKPTSEHLKKARNKGQIPESKEVSSAVMMGALFVAMVLMGGRFFGWMTEQVIEGLSLSPAGPMNGGDFAHLLQVRGKECLLLLGPFLATVAGASMFSSVVVGGLVFSPKAIRLNWGNISPINGMKRLLSLRSVVQLLISIVKLAVILAITWSYMGDHFDELFLLQWTTPQAILYGIGRLLFGLVARIVVALVFIALADLLYQRWNYTKQLRMTRQEVKEERKQQETSPETKGRIRALQIAAMRKRMLQDVPTADVVITNPTHYAVALRYDAENMNAPQIVAKGADFLCEKIKEIANEHGVQIVEKPELARALYATVEVGQAIPDTLFVAVAEVLAMIYRLRK